MASNSRKTSSSPSKSSWHRRIPWLLIPVLVLSFSIANAQQLTATISGIATDQTEARIPGASILVVSDTTGDKRDSTADSSGFWSVTALPPGTYTITVSAKGFASWRETGVLLNQGDSRTLPNIHLKISSDVNSVTVISGQDAEVPTDTAEISATLNNELVDSAVLTGRDAAEMIKMMPGVTFNNGSGSGSGFNSQVTGTNNGPAGSFSANGTQPYGATALILDGANLVDPGNAGTQIANINQDMTDSVKFLSASYGAEYAKGPAILEAFSKSGGQKFHGEAYLYARNTGVGYANDWYNKNQLEGAAAGQAGATPASIAAANVLTPQSFYYAGGNIGGPIFFKGFNRNKDKLFFWAGYEKMIQHPYNAPVQMNVPTGGIAGQPLGQRDGDFNNLGVPSGVINLYTASYQLPCEGGSSWRGYGCTAANSPWDNYGTGPVPNLKPYFDPNGVILSGLNPLANETPSAANGWNNYTYTPDTPQDRWEATGKVTYAFNDNNKLWGSYTRQTEFDNHPLSIWWAPTWAIPYPGKPSGVENARVYLANYTHVFNASTTNEFIFSYSKFVNDSTLQDPAAVNPSNLGFPSQSLFSGKSQDEIPGSEGDWGEGVTEIGQQTFDGGIYGKNTFGKTATSPAITDNFTKIIKTHSIKGGFYWDTQENLQSNSNGPPNPYSGLFQVTEWTSESSTSNDTLDRLMGRNSAGYSEQSTVPTPDVLWHQWSLWAQDSWKATPKLTVNVGLRADHMGQWYDKLGGAQVWDPAVYVNTPNPPANSGLVWHSTLSSIPTSGWKSQLFLYDPRVGVAYDVFGTGKTVVRGGFGTYRYQLSENDSGNAMNGPLGVFTINTQSQQNGFYGYSVAGGQIGNGYSDVGVAYPATTVNVPKGLNQTGAGVNVQADDMNDNKIPYADTWSFGVAQAGPSHTVFQASYVGSIDRNEYVPGTSSGTGINDANQLAYGAYYKPDPTTGVLDTPGAPPCVGPNQPIVYVGCKAPAIVSQHYRPLINYGSIGLLTHTGFSNYNSLQLAAQKQSGNLFLFTNFTFGKVLGTWTSDSSNGASAGSYVNPYNIDSNYGPLAYDHTKTFNVSFSYKLPSPIHGNALLAGPINGWQISGYTTYEDGAPIQAGLSNDLNATYNALVDQYSNPIPSQVFTMPDGLQTPSIGYAAWNGSGEYPGSLQPVLTCDPRKFVKLYRGQKFNPGCFAAPLPPTATSNGQIGQTVWPYIRNPGYFGSDLAVFKAFKIKESQRFEIRVSATNWLNHPNGVFNENGSNADDKLVFNGVSTGSALVYNSNTGYGGTTGAPLDKVGYRWMQFAGKYYF
jgi:Carboxypeptidase regulatory-like domain/TonB-dependent Receptor Plug Domain